MRFLTNSRDQSGQNNYFSRIHRLLRRQAERYSPFAVGSIGRDGSLSLDCFYHHVDLGLELVNLPARRAQRNVDNLFPVVVFEAVARVQIPVQRSAPSGPERSPGSCQFYGLMMLEGAESLRYHRIGPAWKAY